MQPIQIRSPRQLKKLWDVKISSRIISYLECKQISDSQAFRSTQRSNVIHRDNFCCITRNLDCNCTPCYNIRHWIWVKSGVVRFQCRPAKSYVVSWRKITFGSTHWLCCLFSGSPADAVEIFTRSVAERKKTRTWFMRDFLACLASRFELWDSAETFSTELTVEQMTRVHLPIVSHWVNFWGSTKVQTFTLNTSLPD